jgi:hypothetical protein
MYFRWRGEQKHGGTCAATAVSLGRVWDERVAKTNKQKKIKK